MKILSSLALISSILLLSTCEVERFGCTDRRATNYDVTADVDDGSCYYGNDPVYGECLSDFEGNLIIRNETGEKLYLYKGFAQDNLYSEDAFITCIPADTNEFLVYIPNPGLEVSLLQIWKAKDVPNINDPDFSRVHRQWRVALSNSTTISERANWLITGSDEVTGTGTLVMSYPSVDEYGHDVIYQVDIMLNSQTGAKIASLQPGVMDKKVSVDYGVHYLYYHYWYSDPNSSTGEVLDIGWSSLPDIVINESHKDADIDIPVYYSAVGKFGELTVVNENTFVINVYAGDNLIEDLAVVSGSSQGLSSIPAGSQTTFLIPVDEYVITTQDLAGKQEDEFKEVQILQEENAILRSGVDDRTIQITNSTNTTLGLFSVQEEYLGLTIEAGTTSGVYVIPAIYDSLLVIDFARSKVSGFYYSSSVTITELENYEVNRVEMLSLWPDLGDYYESPFIADEQSTTMTASLILSEPAVLSFEYDVSSENGYDDFSFSVNGFDEISDQSGETGWVLFSKAFEPGTYALVWKYQKDQTRAEGRDNVRIRNIAIQ